MGYVKKPDKVRHNWQDLAEVVLICSRVFAFSAMVTETYTHTVCSPLSSTLDSGSLLSIYKKKLALQGSTILGQQNCF